MKQFKILILCIAICTLSACRATPSPKPEDDHFNFSRTNYVLKEGVEESELKGEPWINSNLPGMTAKVEKPSLKDDFYAAANYDELVNNEPGPFDISSDNVATQLRTFLTEETAATNSALLRKSYSLINAGAKTEVHNYLDNVNLNSFVNSKELFLTKNSFFSLYEYGDDQYQITFNDGYLDSEYSFNTLMFFARYYDDYPAVVETVKTNLFSAFDIDIDDEEFEKVSNLEADFSDYVWYYYSNVCNYEYYITTYTIGSTGSASFLNNALIDAGFSNGDELKISNISLQGINYFKYELNEESDLLRDALICRLAFGYRFLASLEKYKPISKALYDTGVFYYEYDLTDANDDKAARHMLKHTLTSLLERAYVELYTSVDIKEQIASIIEQVLAGYADLAEEEDWLDLYTKKGLLRKINNMKYISCYSDVFKSYPAIDETGLESFSMLDIVRKYQEYMFDLMFSDEVTLDYSWDSMPSYTVNAFYSSRSNSFVILNGLLSGGFIGETIEETLAGVGFVIGHEISHSIDESGSKFDENGQYNDWWSSNCKREFTSRVNKVKRFFKRINLFDNTYVNGELVNTEATADMGGMRVCLHIAKSIENFDYDKFFRAYARTWLSKAYTESEIAKQLTNEHPFDYLRCNVTVAQFDEFVETYDIQKGDGMYVPENERIAIW